MVADHTFSNVFRSGSSIKISIISHHFGVTRNADIVLRAGTKPNETLTIMHFRLTTSLCR